MAHVCFIPGQSFFFELFHWFKNVQHFGRKWHEVGPTTIFHAIWVNLYITWIVPSFWEDFLTNLAIHHGQWNLCGFLISRYNMTYPYITYLYDLVITVTFQLQKTIASTLTPRNWTPKPSRSKQWSAGNQSEHVLQLYPGDGPHKMFTNWNLSKFQNSLFLPQGNLTNLKLWEFMVPKTFYCQRSFWLECSEAMLERHAAEPSVLDPYFEYSSGKSRTYPCERITIPIYSCAILCNTLVVCIRYEKSLLPKGKGSSACIHAPCTLPVVSSCIWRRRSSSASHAWYSSCIQPLNGSTYGKCHHRDPNV